ncbi:MAG: hypothetical protein DIZ80_06115 [endosymbiont of Galathealinum brachiosum]|uniref:Sel1 repeat family protein n=1 Tax=endosymbiont of Galathealinum brachiosum TaxID=2200906 RepID=A0A370DFV3_9GAMM|nr:MAG: hypothetical protein DIZ80_06115 [endosymbiont of Galathealinum brachiosum]
MRTLFISIFKISLIFGLLVPVTSFAEMPIYFSDVSAGIFRFQIKLAEQGNPEAQYKVGEMFEMGTGVSKDAQKAQVWFEKAAAQGHKKSGYKLLYLEIQSNGLNDFTKSQLGKLRQEAASGSANAQYFLGKMYSAGVGVPKSLNNALTWLNKATFNGVPEAEHEAISVEEELARIREREAKKRAGALEASKKRKAEDARLKAVKQKEDEKKRKAAAAKRKSNKDAEARRTSEQRRRLEEDRKAIADEKAQLERDRRAADAEKARKAKKEKDAKAKEKASFESDPCKGKSARFLSTCR